MVANELVGSGISGSFKYSRNDICEWLQMNFIDSGIDVLRMIANEFIDSAINGIYNFTIGKDFCDVA